MARIIGTSKYAEALAAARKAQKPDAGDAKSDDAMDTGPDMPAASASSGRSDGKGAASGDQKRVVLQGAVGTVRAASECNGANVNVGRVM